MREHKYKAWDKTNNCWYMDGNIFDLNYSGSYGDFYFDNDNPYNMRDVDLEWVEYTGLHDCNGTPIYEGDIVRCGWHYGDDFGEPVGEMEFTNQVVEYSIGAQGAGFDLNVHGMENAEVIGNIHQHPDLIRKG